MIKFDNQSINILLGIIGGLTLIIPASVDIWKKGSNIKWYKRATTGFYALLFIIGLGVYLTYQKDKLAARDSTQLEKALTANINKALESYGLKWNYLQNALSETRKTKIPLDSSSIWLEIKEIKRLILLKNEPDIKKFIVAYSLLQEEQFKPLEKVITQSCGTLAKEIPLLLNYSTFGSYLEARKVQVKIMNNEEIQQMLSRRNTEYIANAYGLVDYWVDNTEEFYRNLDNLKAVTFAFVAGGRYYRANKSGDKIVETLFSQLKTASNSPYYN